VLAIEGLTLAAGPLHLTQDVSLTIAPGEMLGLVGESGCGKSVTALAVMRLLPEHAIRIAAGRVLFDASDLAALTQREMTEIRGRHIGMVFQEPTAALNPVLTVGAHVAEPMMRHLGLRKPAALARAAELLERVGIAEPRRALERYPHQISGGQRQRVMIASAIACGPKLLIADEPTTALDVTVQAQVLDLIEGLRREMGMACLLITHDLAVVSEHCARAMIMYAGRIVEEGPVAALFGRPRHRYTRALLDTIPAANPPGVRLPAIPGQVPPPGARGVGCAFQPRCAAPVPRCAKDTPVPSRDGDRAFACWSPA
jgi:oligopeptide/dipeptide ABC transporter ATP-binding protein